MFKADAKAVDTSFTVNYMNFFFGEFLILGSICAFSKTHLGFVLSN